MQITKETIDLCKSFPLYKTLGIDITFVENGKAKSNFKPLEAVCHPIPGHPHSSALFGILDITSAFACLSLLDEGLDVVAIGLETKFIKPTAKDSYSCEAEVINKTNSLCFTNPSVTM